MKGPHPRFPWRTSARRGPPTSRWSWRPPSAAARVPTRDGTRGGGVGRRPYAGWGCRSDGSPGGVVGCVSRWRPTTATPRTTSSWQTTWSCRGPLPKGAWSGSGELCPLQTSSRGSYWPSVCRTKTWGRKRAALYWKNIPGVAARGGLIMSYPGSTARTYTKGLATARGSTTQHGLLTATGQTDVYHEEDNRANQSITRLTHASPWSKENLS